eukprot:SAG25_NODE_29_length_20738_cov_25.829546_7_plen_726_part_00
MRPLSMLMIVLMMGGATAAACAADPKAKSGFKGKRRSSRFSRSGGDRKKGRQGGEDKPRAQVKYEQLPGVDTAKYDGELAERRGAIQWVYKALGSPPETEWASTTGNDGTILIIAKRLGLENATHRKMIRRTLELIQAGGDVRQRAGHERRNAQKLAAVEQTIIADCLTSAFGLSQTTAQVNCFRAKKEKRRLGRDLTAEELKKCEVGRETVRRWARRQDGDCHRRQGKKSGTDDRDSKWAKACLAQAKQQQVQLKAGAGDSVARRKCTNEGWTPIALEQISWWDERHRKCILGCASTYEWRFPVDPQHPECRLKLCDGGVLPDPLPYTTAKYLSEARKSLGVMMREEGGEMVGVRQAPFTYNNQIMVGLDAYRKAVKAEVKRVETLVGGEWKKAPKLDTPLASLVTGPDTFAEAILDNKKTVRDLPGGRWQALYPGPTRAGKRGTDEERLSPRPEWAWEMRKVLGRGTRPIVSVTDMMDHIIWEGNIAFKDTDYKDNWVIGHDHLSQWWAKDSLAYLHSRGFGPNRYLCAQGQTNADNRYYKGSLVGNRPELMPLDSHLNADHERGMMWHVALTSNLPKEDQRKFKMATPADVSDTMDRTWEVFPRPERIVSDIRKFPRALQAIIDAEGTVVPEIDNRKGRRSTGALPYHPDCDEAMDIRQAKWEAAEESAASVRDSLSQETFEGEEEQDLWIWDNANTATGEDDGDEEGADLGLEDRAVVRAV